MTTSHRTTLMQLPIWLMLVFSLSATADDGSEVLALHGLLDRFLAGASTNDREIHDRFWADDLVYTSSSGARFGKAEIMAGLNDAGESDQPGPSYGARDVNIRVFGETAVLTFTLVATGVEGDEKHYYNSGVFRERGGQWQAIVWQATVASP